MKRAFILLLFSACSLAGTAFGAAFNYQPISKDAPSSEWRTVVGWIGQHVVSKGETLLDIARNHELGWNEIEILYPDLDPWVPESGLTLDIPQLWILPSEKHEGIVINVPELRLYRYIPGTNMVETYPVGIGTEDYQTPLGEYEVLDRKEKPVWRVPPSLREKYPFDLLPPGPKNPLGDYWLGLSAEHIGIHGTNFPWAVGRQVSRGCIRLYPEHIERLYPVVPVGTTVRIVYEPIKIGFLNGNIFLEVHPDTDGIKTDLKKIMSELLQDLGKECYISGTVIENALLKKNGVPICIGSSVGGGEKTALSENNENNGISNEAMDRYSGQ